MVGHLSSYGLKVYCGRLGHGRPPSTDIPAYDYGLSTSLYNANFVLFKHINRYVYTTMHKFASSNRCIRPVIWGLLSRRLNISRAYIDAVPSSIIYTGLYVYHLSYWIHCELVNRSEECAAQSLVSLSLEKYVSSVTNQGV